MYTLLFYLLSLFLSVMFFIAVFSELHCFVRFVCFQDHVVCRSGDASQSHIVSVVARNKQIDDDKQLKSAVVGDMSAEHTCCIHTGNISSLPQHQTHDDAISGLRCCLIGAYRACAALKFTINMNYAIQLRPQPTTTHILPVRLSPPQRFTEAFNVALVDGVSTHWRTRSYYAYTLLITTDSRSTIRFPVPVQAKVRCKVI